MLDSWFAKSAPQSVAQRFTPTHPSPRFYAAVAAGSLGSLLLVRFLLNSPRSAPAPIPSPRKTVLPDLAPEDIDVLPYPPDALPGARDVKSPYGSIRVYEWGPEDGECVLLIHGISTPSIALSDLAYRLVRKGCRVMLFGTSTISQSRSFDHCHGPLFPLTCLSSLTHVSPTAYHLDRHQR